MPGWWLRMDEHNFEMEQLTTKQERLMLISCTVGLLSRYPYVANSFWRLNMTTVTTLEGCTAIWWTNTLCKLHSNTLKRQNHHYLHILWLLDFPYTTPYQRITHHPSAILPWLSAWDRSSQSMAAVSPLSWLPRPIGRHCTTVLHLGLHRKYLVGNL